MDHNNTPEEWVRDLLAAGWKKWNGMSTVWQSPAGHLFRGPYKAWTLMHSHPELNEKALEGE